MKCGAIDARFFKYPVRIAGCCPTRSIFPMLTNIIVPAEFGTRKGKMGMLSDLGTSGRDMVKTASAIPAPNENPQDWLSNQPDLIEDGNCGCRMRLESCRERQKQYPHVTSSETLRDKFILCLGCRYFKRVAWDKK